MTALESSLRARLHAQLDELAPSTSAGQAAVRAGRRARRRRTALASAATALVVIIGSVTSWSLLDGPDPRPDSVVAASGLSDRTGAYAEQFRDGDFASIRKDMTPEVRALLSESRLRSGWQEVIANLGPLLRIPPAVKDGTTSGVYLSRLHFRSGDANLRVTYDGTEQVIGITILLASVDRPSAVPPALVAASRQVVADLAAGRYGSVRDRFDTTMTRVISQAQLRSGWEQGAVREHGGLVSIGGLSATTLSGATVIDVRCIMKRGDINVRISFDAAGQISGLLLQNP